MTCYLLFYAPVKKLVPRGSGRPIGGGGGGGGGGGWAVNFSFYFVQYGRINYMHDLQ